MLLFGLEVASETCREIIYYAKKDWVGYNDLIDVPFDEDQAMIVNSKSLGMRQNVFGTLDTPKSVHHSAFDGTSSYKANYNMNPDNPNYFAVSFGKKIKIKEIQFEIKATRFDTNEAIKKLVYINGNPRFSETGKLVVSGSPIFLTKNNERMILDLNYQEVEDILVLFDTSVGESSYELSYFQIFDYKMFEVVEWTEDKIENTEVKKVIACSGSGNFTPDGCKDWTRYASTIFSPSSSLISQYIPLLDRQQVYYDWGRGGYNWPYASPDIVKNIGGVSNQIKGWKREGSNPYVTDYSYGEGLIEFPYIMTGKSTGVQYVVSPYFWSQIIQGNYLSVSSNDQSWCNHVTGVNRAPCYKHAGHSTNTRQNVYDVFINDYRDVVEPSLRVIEKVEYFIVNDETKSEVKIREGNENAESFELNETGKWRIKAILYDRIGKSGVKQSNIFLIDRDNPIATFVSNKNDDETIRIDITPFDEHSGVKRWKYSVTKDGGKTYERDSGWLVSNKERILFSQSGNYNIKVEVEDKVGNLNTIYSEEILVEVERLFIRSILAESYELNEETPIYLNIDCKGCDVNSQTMTILQNNQIIKDIKLTQNNNKILTSFVPNSKDETVLTFKIDNELTDLPVYEKSREFKETNESILQFEAIVVSGIDSNKQIKNYMETLILNFKQDKYSLMSGEGIEHRISSDYVNECRIIEDFECKSGVINDDGKLDSQFQSGTAFIEYEEGAEIVKNKYIVNDKYNVPLEYLDSMYILPIVYVDKKSGLVYSENNENYLNGGRKWYTNPRGDLKKYQGSAIGNEVATNKFSWKFNFKYEIDRFYYESFNLHFVDPSDPFKNEESQLWKPYMDWFKNLSKSHVLKQIELRNE